MQSSNLLSIEALLDSHNRTPQIILTEVIQRIGKALQVDRGFIAVRDPSRQRCRIAFMWRHDESIPDIPFGMEWNNENNFTDDDPLYRAALACRSSVYVTDIETAQPEVVNREFENHYFGHRALIHGHIIQDGQL
ncbi:unnamed protein product [Adineta steineri]|uniref:GAF domain-containing protein n=1 Tax=Adineta steineri TaxID=433720 RepID=A0A813NZ76_9BILA|nr:unnamed protein product [Adineta steineri]CAF1491696.1 unnamed protein product [Adineta steineri]CAF3833306.1 unnamed protein product [Adineta steineri]CAF4061411.1 unnamed protein product [Adineta steineri]